MFPRQTAIQHTILGLLISFFVLSPLHALEKPNDANIKTALIYNICQHFEWPQYAHTDTFLVGVFGADSVMNNTLKQIEERMILERPVKVLFFPQLHTIYNTDVLYVNHTQNYEIEKAYRLIKNTNTLLISDRCEDKQAVMINFIHDTENKISFELNKRNIDDEELKMSPRILLLGGTEIDIRELYLQTEKVLEFEKNRTIQVENQLKQKEAELARLNTELDELQIMMYEQNQLIQVQQGNIQSQTHKLMSLQDSLKLISGKTESQSLLLDSLNSSLQRGNREKIMLDSQLSKRMQEVDSVNQTLNLLHYNIAKQEEVLTEQDQEIKYLRRSRQVIFTALIVFLLLITVILGSYRTIRKKNREIEKQAAQLILQKDSLQQANEELQVQKETLQKTLDALHRTQDQLIESEKMASLGQLSAGIAHEINNPINFISSSIEGLKVIIEDLMIIVSKYDQVNVTNMDEKLTEIARLKEELEFKEVLSGFTVLTDNIKSGIDRTKEIVNSMRVFYRSGDGGTSKVDLNKLLASTVILIKNQIKNRIKVITSYGDIPEIECQSGMISQAFLNIIDNSIQAIAKKGTITIATRKIIHNGIDVVQVDIADTGSGIPEKIAKRIYDPFFTTKDVGKGTGLGMYLTYNIIHNHQGELKFESIPDRGTIFHIFLPIIQQENKPATNLDID